MGHPLLITSVTNDFSDDGDCRYVRVVVEELSDRPLLSRSRTDGSAGPVSHRGCRVLTADTLLKRKIEI